MYNASNILLCIQQYEVSQMGHFPDMSIPFGSSADVTLYLHYYMLVFTGYGIMVWMISYP